MKTIITHQTCKAIYHIVKIKYKELTNNEFIEKRAYFHYVPSSTIEYEKITTLAELLENTARELFPDKMIIREEMIRHRRFYNPKVFYQNIYKAIENAKNQEFETNSKYLKIFKKFCGFSDWAPFLQYCKEEKLLTNKDIKEQKKFLNIKEDFKKLLYYYAYFFLKKDIIVKAKLSIDEDQSVEMRFEKLEGIDYQDHRGQIDIKKESAFIVLENKSDGKKALVCSIGFNSPDEDGIVKGTYAGTNDEHIPVAGIICFVRISKNYETLKDVPYKRIIPSKIKAILKDTRFEISTESLLNSSNKSFSKSIVGVYEMYHFNNRENALRLSVLKIEESGAVNCKSVTEFIYIGKVQPIKYNSNLIISLFTPNFKYTAFQLAIDLGFDHSYGQKGTYEGIHSGIDSRGKLFAGRSLLVKVNRKYEEIQPIQWNYGTKSFLNIIQEKESLNDYLSGVGKDSEGLITPFKFYSIQKKDGNRIEGIYEVYFLSSTFKIRKHTLYIKKNGQILIHERGRYRGVAHIYHGCLIINIQSRSLENHPEPTGIPRFIHQISAFIGSSGSSENSSKIIEGVYNGIADRYYPIGLRCILIKTDFVTKEDYNKNCIPYEKIEIGSTRFVEINDRYNGLGNYLLGTTNNQVIAKKDTIKKNAPLTKDEDFGLIYFQSACYMASKGFFSEENIVKKLKKAKEHGFNDLNLLKVELGEEGSLSHYKKSVEEVFGYLHKI